MARPRLSDVMTRRDSGVCGVTIVSSVTQPVTRLGHRFYIIEDTRTLMLHRQRILQEESLKMCVSKFAYFVISAT